jgi:hypothetical protein
MRPAASLYHLKKRVDAYLWKAPAPPMQRLRQALRDNFLHFDRIAIIGGILRDFARSGRGGFASDVDLVIDVDPVSLDGFAQKLGATRNRFGGYALKTPWWKIDFWALKNTWAHRQFYVRLSTLADLPKSTFFNFDAIIYDIHEKEIYAADNYIDILNKRVLEINLLPNPSIDGNLIRAIRRTIAWDVRMGPRLKSFVDEHLDYQMFGKICETERKLYPEVLIGKFADPDAVREYCFFRSSRIPAHSQAGFQYEFPV